jgi:hypothetical protein
MNLVNCTSLAGLTQTAATAARHCSSTVHDMAIVLQRPNYPHCRFLDQDPGLLAVTTRQDCNKPLSPWGPGHVQLHKVLKPANKPQDLQTCSI